MLEVCDAGGLQYHLSAGTDLDVEHTLDQVGLEGVAGIKGPDVSPSDAGVCDTGVR